MRRGHVEISVEIKSKNIEQKPNRRNLQDDARGWVNMNRYLISVMASLHPLELGR